MTKKATLLCLLVISSLQCVFCDLMEDIFTNYSITRIPVINTSAIMKINTSVHLGKLYELNMRDQSITAHINLDMIWEDEFLAWNPKTYDGVNKIQVPTTKIWFPDLAIYNSNENAQDIGQDSHKVEISSSGIVRYWGYKIFTYTCGIDITWYPFDTQSCSVNVGMWYNNNSLVRLYDESNKSVSDNARLNGEFEIKNGGSIAYFDIYDGQNFSARRYVVRFERKWFYEVSRALIPVVAISFLNCLTFALPVGSGERITMCISIFLAYIFMLNMLSDLQPRTSDGISLLGIYVNIQLISSIITVTLSIFSLNTYHKGEPSFPSVPCIGETIENRHKETKVNINGTEINDNIPSHEYEKNKHDIHHPKFANKFDAVLLRLSFVFQALLLLCIIMSVVIMKTS